jgi:L-Ala-D/L-Glu epimerase
VAQSVAFLRATASLELAYLEQPLPDDDLVGLATLTRAGLGAVASDEGIHGLGDIDANAAAGLRWFGLKLIKLGGYGHVRSAHARCAAVGGWSILASKMAESSVAAGALAHLAVTMPHVLTGASFTHTYLASM